MAIPPMLSSTPPPLDDQDDDEEDEFGDFRVSDIYGLNDVSLSLQSSESPPPWKKPHSPPISPLKSKVSHIANLKPNGLCKVIKNELDFNQTTEIENSISGTDTTSQDSAASISSDLETQQQDGILNENINLNKDINSDINENNIENLKEPESEDASGVQEEVETISEDLNLRTSELSNINLENNRIDDTEETNQTIETDITSGEVNDSDVPKSSDNLFSSVTSEGIIGEYQDNPDNEFEYDSYSGFQDSGDVTDSKDIPDIIFVKPTLDDNDFGDFANFDNSNLLDSESKQLNIGCDQSSNSEEFNISSKIADVEDTHDINSSLEYSSKEDDFNAFSTPCAEIKDPGFDDDDFGDFEEFSKAVEPVPEASSSLQNEVSDDFAYDDFQSVSSNDILCVIKSVPQPEDVINSLFPKLDEPTEDESNTRRISDCLSVCLDDSSSVWGNLKELETSHALSYQWSSSTSNKSLLSSLNIDSRNLLFGPRWNTNVPRFAANLGLSPLEPVQAASCPETSSQDATKPSISVDEVVPAAQFDWTSSGLTNPLDSVEKITKTPTTGAEELSNSEQIKVIDNILEPISLSENQIQYSTTVLAPTVLSHDPQKNFDVILSPELPAGVPAGSSSETTLKTRRKEDLTPEALQVVERIPDLSFLSARKLMYTANANTNRFSHKAGVGH